MRKISDTIARLTTLQTRRTRLIADHGAADRLSTLSGFGSNPGALKARIYLPNNRPEHAPLVVVLHGCTQNAAGYDHHSGWSQLADEGGFALLFPEQQRANNPNLCFNWFLSHDTKRGSGETLSIRQMIQAMVERHGLDAHRIFVTGLSAGGAMAAAMLASYPEVFASGAIIAGIPYGSAKTVPEAFDRMRGHGGPSEQALQQALYAASDHQGPWPKVSIWHGSDDHTVAPSNAEAIAAQWRGVHQVQKASTYLNSTGRHSKQAWFDVAGETLIEVNMIDGMGHGTPIGDDLGAPGPYMLAVGISSTREIARFWGIGETTDNNVAARSTLGGRASEGPPSHSHVPGMKEAKTRSPEPTAVHQLPRRTTSDAAGVKKIIEDALRAAGLMR